MNCWIQLALDTVVLDETGTITERAPALTDSLGDRVRTRRVAGPRGRRRAVVGAPLAARMVARAVDHSLELSEAWARVRAATRGVAW